MTMRCNLPLVDQLKLAGLPPPLTEHRFAPPRRWRFDLCWQELKLAVEIEGGTWLPTGGRHNRAKGYANDCRKYNEAVLYGWWIIRVTTEMVKNGEALAIVERAYRQLNERGR